MDHEGTKLETLAKSAAAVVDLKRCNIITEGLPDEKLGYDLSADKSCRSSRLP
jgi:hypothetical protein